MLCLTVTLLAIHIVNRLHGQQQIVGRQLVVNVSIIRSSNNNPLSDLPMPSSPILFDPMSKPTYAGNSAAVANSECSQGQERVENNAFVMVCENGRFRPRSCLIDGRRIESGATLNLNGYVYSCIKLPMGIELKPTACLDDTGVPQYPGNTFVEQKNFLFECRATSMGAVRKQVVGCMGDDQRRASFGSTVFVRGVTASCMKVGRSARIVGQTKGTLVVGNIVSPCQQPSNSVKDSSYAPGSPISSCPYQQPTSPDNSNYQAPGGINGNLNSPSIGNSYVPPANPGINADFSGPLANPSSPTSSDSYVKPAIPNSPLSSNSYGQLVNPVNVINVDFNGPSANPGSPSSSDSYVQPAIPISPISSNSYGQPVNPVNSINVDFNGPVVNPSNPTSSDSYVQPAIPNSPISGNSNGQPVVSSSSYEQPVNPINLINVDFNGPLANPSSPINSISNAQQAIPGAPISNSYGQPTNPSSLIPGNSYGQPVDPSNNQYQQPQNLGVPINPYSQPVNPNSTYQQPGSPVSNVNQNPDVSMNGNPYQPQLINPGGLVPGSSGQQPVNPAGPIGNNPYEQPPQMPSVEVAKVVQV